MRATARRLVNALTPTLSQGERGPEAVLLCLLLAVFPAHAAPAIEHLRAFAWTGGWGQNLRAPSCDAPAAGDVSGNLEDALKVTWHREGDTCRVGIERVQEAWCGMLGVELAFAPGAATFAYGMEDLPVSLPLDRAARGRELVGSWHPNAPWWVLASARSGAAGALIRTEDGHGFQSSVDRDGRLILQLRLMLPKVGERREAVVRLVSGKGAAALRAVARRERAVPPDPPIDRARAKQLRAGGFVKVDRAGGGFVVGGQPWYPVGFNCFGGSLPCLPPAEQERRLAQMAAAGMNTVRLLTCDWIYRPLPGAVNAAGVQRLRETIDRAAAHGIRSAICLEYGGAGYQYHASRHRGTTVEDLFHAPAALTIYGEMVDGVVKPLRDDPAILAWTVTNEPVSYLGPSPAKLAGWRAWLKAHAVAEDTPAPADAEWQTQSTPAARDFLAFDLAITADALIARAKLLRAADPRHLVSVSDTLGRALRGRPGAEVFDFWAPHTYDLWLNGPLIGRHVAFLTALHRDTLPDRPRPVMIEEFGIQEKPEYPEAMRAEHIRQFVAAGQRHGLAGLLHWWEMTGAQFDAFGTGYHVEPEPAGPVLAAWLPHSQEWNLLFYDRYMVRRGWEAAMATAAEAGLRVRVVSEPAEAPGAAALLVLGDTLTPAEAQALAAAARPVYLLPTATLLPAATVLPKDAAAQGELWRKVAQP